MIHYVKKNLLSLDVGIKNILIHHTTYSYYVMSTQYYSEFIIKIMSELENLNSYFNEKYNFI